MTIYRCNRLANTANGLRVNTACRNFARLFVSVLLIVPLFAAGQFFSNPILKGFYPDPAICKAGSDYYMTVSTFTYFPGLPIFHSTDLVNWRQIGSAMDRAEQLNLEGAGVSRGLFAPSITYHNGRFYIVCTLVDKGGNFIITATNPAGPWSNPVWLPEINGIDPSLYIESDEEAYILYNSIPPDNVSRYNGHRTIRINRIDLKTLKVVSDNRILVNGGTDFSKKPVWIEAPRILNKDGIYYLVCAEGGTAYNHSEVVFRARSLADLFIPYEGNPILTQRHLDAARPYPITTTGHADLVQDSKGKWWGVFLGCRPYKGNHFNTGRETFMAPVQWKDGWPVFDLGGDTVRYRYPIDAQQNAVDRFSGNYIFDDDFDVVMLNPRYLFLRTPLQRWHHITSGALEMDLRPESCNSTSNPSFIGFRQPHLRGSVNAQLVFSTKASNEKAGLLVFQNEQHYYFLCVGAADGKPVVQLWQAPGKHNRGKPDTLIAQQPLVSKAGRPVGLRVEARGETYAFLYSTNKKSWQVLREDLDATFLSTETAGGFVGCLYAMYATSQGKPSSLKASFLSFSCASMDETGE